MICGLSENLSKDDLKALTVLEHELGKTILAFSCADVKPADMTEEQISKIKDVEKKLGKYLIAFNR